MDRVLVFILYLYIVLKVIKGNVEMIGEINFFVLRIIFLNFIN